MPEIRLLHIEELPQAVQLADLIFNPVCTVPIDPALKELFPVPFPYTAGFNYV